MSRRDDITRMDMDETDKTDTLTSVALVLDL